jgi:hypothetical protein
MLLVNETLTVSSYLVQLVVVTLGHHVLDLRLQVLLRNRHIIASGFESESFLILGTRGVCKQ